MLEISHLSKIYKNKVGKDVVALDDVSLKFPETGMVFLLGKSGSGKSTLLNVTGGLDNPSSGEIIIKGKSSKNFTQSDFDSYRNTYIGFIFQEYNILDEFTVYDNIAIAIELQNKKVNHDDIIKLLEDVDLIGYENRKPNTLSGGQKQRIAIARALIKHPQIIMADEPTGALDSNTGKQVLDTLKKLSSERLVIVVSHDREFAENYADRIIELSDGKVISDNTKVHVKPEVSNSNFNIIGDTVCINNFKDMNIDDFNKFKDFLMSSDEVILSRNHKNVSSVKKLLNINDDMEQEVFNETDVNNLVIKEYDQNKNIFIKSKLPLKHAIKIGFSGLKIKPFRLLFTIFLCCFSFVLFGLLSTMLFYDNEDIFKSTLSLSDIKYINLGKNYRVKYFDYYDNDVFEYENNSFTSFYESDYKEIKEKYGKDVFYGVTLRTTFPTQKSDNDYYYSFITNFSYFDKDNYLNVLIKGNYPKNEKEILLTSYIVDSMIYYNTYDANNDSINITSRDEIIGKEFVFNNKKYKVSGYLDIGEIPEKYDELKNGDATFLIDMDFSRYLYDSLYLHAFVSEKELKNLSYVSDFSYSSDISLIDFTPISYSFTNNDEFPNYSNGFYINSGSISNDNFYGSKLTSNGVYVSPNVLVDLVLEKIENDEKGFSKYEKELDLALEIRTGGYDKDGSFINYTQDEIISKTKKLYELMKGKLSVKFKFYSYEDSMYYGDKYKFDVVGVDLKHLTSNVLVLDDETFNKVWDVQKANVDFYTMSETKYNPVITQYQNIFIPLDETSTVNDMWDIYKNNLSFNDTIYNSDDSVYIVEGQFIQTLEILDGVVNMFSKVFLYGGIILCLFAALMLSNFISISISNKTKEIGILRAVGARSLDVFKIFFSESFAISFICLIISLILCVVVCNLLNSILIAGLGVSVFVFGLLSVLIIVIICGITTIVATYLPVRKAAKRKPVESIRSL